MFGVLHVRTGQIDFIDDRNDDMVVRHRQIDIGNGLSLDALCGIDQQERPLASRQASRDFIGKIDVAGRIDQVQGVRLPVFGFVPDRHGMGLDSDSPLTLQIHGVEDLVFGLSGRDCACGFEEPVSEG